MYLFFKDLLRFSYTQYVPATSVKMVDIDKGNIFSSPVLFAQLGCSDYDDGSNNYRYSTKCREVINIYKNTKLNNRLTIILLK